MFSQADSREGSLENFNSSTDSADVKVTKFGSVGSASGILTGTTTTITIGKPAPDTTTISSFRSDPMSTVYLSPFADTVSPAKSPLQQTLPRRKSGGLPIPSPTIDSKPVPSNGSRDHLLLFQV
jgi:hypothetical protein